MTGLRGFSEGNRSGLGNVSGLLEGLGVLVGGSRLARAFCSTRWVPCPHTVPMGTQTTLHLSATSDPRPSPSGVTLPSHQGVALTAASGWAVVTMPGRHRAYLATASQPHPCHHPSPLCFLTRRTSCTSSLCVLTACPCRSAEQGWSQSGHSVNTV